MKMNEERAREILRPKRIGDHGFAKEIAKDQLDMLAEIDRLRSLNKELVEALEKAFEAMSTWTAGNAPEYCGEDHVKEATARLQKHGSIAYIADATQCIVDALEKANAQS